MKFIDQHGAEVWVSAHACRKLHSFLLRARSMETGGLLFGQITGQQLIIKTVSGPQAPDLHAAATFVRDEKAAQRTVNRYWLRTQQRLEFVGEWHSHPGGQLDPSARDSRTYFRVRTLSKIPSGRYLLLLAKLERRLQLALWEGVKKELRQLTRRD